MDHPPITGADDELRESLRRFKEIPRKVLRRRLEQTLDLGEVAALQGRAKRILARLEELDGEPADAP